MSNNIQAGGAAYKLSLQDDLTKDLRSTLKDAVTTVQAAVRGIDAEVKKIGHGIQGLGKQLAGLGAGTAAFGAGALFGFGKAVKAAGDFAETINMFDAVFKDQSNSVRQWAKDYGKQIGRAEAETMNFLAQAQDTFVPLGFDRKEAAELSKTVTKLAYDLGSFKNIDSGDAMQRILGGLIGNTENLRAFGVVAQEAQIKAEALSQGFDPNNLTAYQKALSILQILIKGTADAQGDAERTSGSFANSMRALRAAVEDLKTAIGAPLLDAVTSMVQGITAGVNRLKELFDISPLVSQGLAAVSIAMTALGATAAGIGSAIVVLGKTIAAAGVFALAWTVRIQGATKALQLWTGVARAASGLSFSSIGAGIKNFSMLGGVLRMVANLFKGLVSLVVGKAATLGKAFLKPFSIISAGVTLAMKALEGFYLWESHLGGIKGKGLEQERRVALGRTYADMGLTGQDVTKTFNPNGARVAPGAAAQGLPALTEAQRGLAEEINAIRSPLELFRENVQNAAELLKRGEISQGQFDAYKKQQFDQFRQSDPQTQARDSLIEQLKTPAEQLKQAIRQARMLFADDAKNFGRAVRAAVDQFKATDPAEQLKQQLMTPAEIFRQSVAEYRRLLEGQPELLRRAIGQAVEQFKAAMPKPEDDPLAKEIEKLQKGDRIKKAAKQVAQIVAAVKNGLIGKEEGKAMVERIKNEAIGETPIEEIRRSANATNAYVASRIGAFAPAFQNTASEERAWQRNLLKLQKDANRFLAAIEAKNPVFS